MVMFNLKLIYKLKQKHILKPNKTKIIVILSKCIVVKNKLYFTQDIILQIKYFNEMRFQNVILLTT